MICSSIPNPHANAVLTIDLAAIRNNYAILQRQLGGVECAAVIKANGYGLGADKVASTLLKAGCNKFFVAHLEEGISLRQSVGNAEIHILNGLLAGAEDTYREHQLTPVLGSLSEISAWQAYTANAPLPCDIHVDTGMLRLGLAADELQHITASPGLIAGLDIKNIMSHLASADDIHSTQNAAQLEIFNEVRELLPMGKACLANSSGAFLGALYHFDLARPGMALYGLNPTPDSPNPMQGVVELKARIIQIRDALEGETVGYGATHKVAKPSRIATLAVGYADGYLRSLSSHAYGYIGTYKIPLVGRVSMDLITFDVSQVPDNLCQPGSWVELIGSQHSVDDLASEGGTIGYEVLTSLGTRYHRVYTNE